MNETPNTEQMEVNVNGKPRTIDVPINWVRPEEWKFRSDLMTEWLNAHPGVDVIPPDEVDEIYRTARRIFFDKHKPTENGNLPAEVLVVTPGYRPGDVIQVTTDITTTSEADDTTSKQDS